MTRALPGQNSEAAYSAGRKKLFFWYPPMVVHLVGDGTTSLQFAFMTDAK